MSSCRTSPSSACKGARSVSYRAGAVSGVTTDSQYRRYDPAGPGRSDLPALEITHVDPFVSAGKLLKGEFQVGDLVVESAHAYLTKPIRLAVEGDFVTQQDRGLAQRLRQALGRLPGFQMSGGRSDADWIVYLLRPERNGRDYVYASTQHTLPRPSLQQPPEAWVINRQEKLLHERMRVPLSEPEAGLARLKDNLQRFARVQEIKQLDARSGRPALTVMVSLLRPDPGCKTKCRELGTETYRQFDRVKLESLATQQLQVEDILTLALKNEDPERDYYVYLLDLSPDGGIHPVFPSPEDRQEHARVKAGEEREARLRWWGGWHSMVAPGRRKRPRLKRNPFRRNNAFYRK